MQRYIFDVGGTLAAYGCTLKTSHKQHLLEFAKNNSVSFVSGLDYKSLQKYVGTNVLYAADYVFACGGTSIYKKGKLISGYTMELSDLCYSWLKNKHSKSLYPYKNSSNFLLHKKGCATYSTIGPNSNSSLKKEYRDWDAQTLERRNLVVEFNKRFPLYKASIDGRSSINICNKEHDRNTVLNYFDKNDSIYFFSASSFMLGSDYELAKEILNRGSVVYTIDSFTNTYDILLVHEYDYYKNAEI